MKAPLTALGLLSMLLAGCPLAHDEPVPQACKNDDDCFIAQGEYCDRPAIEEDGVCRLRRDAGAPDQKLIPDTSPLDLPTSLDGPGSEGMPDTGPDGAPAPDAGGE